jgi:hypothetical protein
MNSLVCSFCKKSFSTKGNCQKHLSICKVKKDSEVIKNKNEIEQIKQDNVLLKQEVDRLKFQIISLEKILLESTKNSKQVNNSNCNNTRNSNNTQNTQNITINTSLSIKDLLSNLEPIDFNEMKNSFENNLSNKYIDKGIEGLARFICEVPCQNKFLTTDYARKVISYKTPEQQIVVDPKANILINTAIKQNADIIIDKAEDRYQYWKTQVSDALEENIEPDKSDIENKLQTKYLKSMAEKAKTNISIESSNATNLIILKGMENKNVINCLE